MTDGSSVIEDVVRTILSDDISYYFLVSAVNMYGFDKHVIPSRIFRTNGTYTLAMYNAEFSDYISAPDDGIYVAIEYEGEINLIGFKRCEYVNTSTSSLQAVVIL